MSEIALFEVKFVLAADTVFENPGDPFPTLRVRPEVLPDAKFKVMRVAFVDGQAGPLRKQDWTVRARHNGDDGKLKVSFKKRCALVEGLEAARAKADAEFGPGLGGGTGEIDWTSCKQTLSISFKGYEGDPIPVAVAATQTLPAALPQPLADALRTGLRQHGPVDARRWTATVPGVGQKLEIEAWRLAPPGISESIVVEVSFEEKDEVRAGAARDRLRRYLVSVGVVAIDEAFKTNALLDRYPGGPPTTL